jgi:hypothetical protein
MIIFKIGFYGVEFRVKEIPLNIRCYCKDIADEENQHLFNISFKVISNGEVNKVRKRDHMNVISRV